ncbi:ladderlectin-like isoform X1 [Brienomyrus brachyistius]|uniref:ladderlectin-like isoform X1 n=1 Tax=Brienomyrus brachyistius TaxID=42636 RepID=UPI0020B3008E|nr:ladderlectin-like isoform X1 [Brienomyrus brachyistius]
MGLLTISTILYTIFSFSGAFWVPEVLQNETKSLEPSIGFSSELNIPTANCPGGWHQYHSRCFYFEGQPKSWVDAQNNCIHLKGTLASIHSFEEYQFVQRVTGSHFPRAWIGAFDAVKVGTWLWIDGTPFDFTKWNPGEPNNPGVEDCAEINYGAEKGWNNLRCMTLLPSVCAKLR